MHTLLSHVRLVLRPTVNRPSISLCLWQGGLTIDKYIVMCWRRGHSPEAGPQLSGVTDTVIMASHSHNFLVSSRPVETWSHQGAVSSMIDWSCAVNIHLIKFGGSLNIQLKLGRSDCRHMISHSEIFSLYCGGCGCKPETSVLSPHKRILLLWYVALSPLGLLGLVTWMVGRLAS